MITGLLVAICATAILPGATAGVPTDCRPLTCADYAPGNALVSWFQVDRTGDPADGYTFTVVPAVSGSTIWVAAGTHLVAYDASDPGAPRRISSLPVATEALVVNIVGNLAYVTGRGGLSIVDIADATRPTIIRAIAQPRSLHKSAYRDGYLYVAGDNYIHRIDVRYPPHPIVVESFYCINQVSDLEFHGDQLITGDWERISGINVDGAGGMVVAWRVPVTARDMAIMGDCLYVDSYHEMATYRFANSPGTVPTRVAVDPLLGSRWLAAAHGRIYADDVEGVRVFDATSAAGLVEVGRLPGTKSYLAPVPLGDLLVASTQWSMIQLLDPRRAAFPPESGRAALPTPTAAGAIATGGMRAFVTYGSKRNLAAFDLSDPLQPVLIGESAGLPYPASCLALRGDYLFINGLQCYDVSNPAVPQAVNSNVDGRHFVVAGDIAFVAGGASSGDFSVLRAVDIRDPARPLEIGRLNLGADLGAYSLLALDGERLVVGEGARLTVVDVADPRAMRRHAEINVEVPYCRGLDLAGDLVFHQGSQGELRTFDIRNPTLPRQRSVFRPPQNTEQRCVLAGDGVVYLGSTDYGLLIVDVSDPDRPRLIGNIGTPGRYNAWLGQAVLTDDHIIIVSTDGQLKVAPRQCGDVTPTAAVSIVVEPQDRCHRVPCGPRARGTIRVAVLSDKAFDAATVDAGTLRFGPGDAAPRHQDRDSHRDHRPDRDGISLRDIDCDGDLDLVVRFDARDAGFACGDTLAGLTGATRDGASFCGAAPVSTTRACAEPGGDDRLANGDKALGRDHLCGEKDLVPGNGGPAAGAFSVAPAAVPNPFNPGTEISFSLVAACRLEVDLYDLAGRRVTRLAAGEFAPGGHRVPWRGADDRGAPMPSGVYLARIRGEGLEVTLRLALLR